MLQSNYVAKDRNSKRLRIGGPTTLKSAPQSWTPPTWLPFPQASLASELLGAWAEKHTSNANDTGAAGKGIPWVDEAADKDQNDDEADVGQEPETPQDHSSRDEQRPSTLETSAIPQSRFRRGARPLVTTGAFQVGTAILRIERLEILGHYESINDYFGVPYEAESDRTATDNSSSGAMRPSNSKSTITGPGGTRRVPPDDEEEDEEQDKRYKNRDGRHRDTTERKRIGERQRFACPYQVYQPWRDCLRAGRRNPSGGCDGISRLKQHLARRHMHSHRCRRCWNSYDVRRDLEEHMAGNCEEVEAPSGEWFMDERHEAEVENCAADSSEDTWWSLFQLLIPGLQEVPLWQLRMHYSPYYLRLNANRTLELPALQLPPLSFEPHLLESLSSEQAPAASTAPVLSQPGLLAANTSAIELTSSESFSVPVYQAWDTFEVEGAGDLSPFPTTTMPPPLAPSALPPTSPPSLSHSSATPSSSAAASTSASGAVSPEHTRRMHDRLRKRALRAEAENASLRERLREARSEIDAAETVLEGLLDEGSIQNEVTYERVETALGLLIAAGGKLR